MPHYIIGCYFTEMLHRAVMIWEKKNMEEIQAVLVEQSY